jgi:hypothetical protein
LTTMTLLPPHPADAATTIRASEMKLCLDDMAGAHDTPSLRNGQSMRFRFVSGPGQP